MSNCYVQFGEWGGPYRTVKAKAVKEVECSPNPYAHGYGSKIPMPYMVKVGGGFGNRWRRVYCAQYANACSTYIKVDGVDTIVDIQIGVLI
jgi:hypothetical protein